MNFLVDDREGTAVRVVGPEHLIAPALQTGGRKRLLQTQRQDYPLLAGRVSLKPWERPWEIVP